VFWERLRGSCPFVFAIACRSNTTHVIVTPLPGVTSTGLNDHSSDHQSRTKREHRHSMTDLFPKRPALNNNASEKQTKKHDPSPLPLLHNFSRTPDISTPETRNVSKSFLMPRYSSRWDPDHITPYPGDSISSRYINGYGYVNIETHSPYGGGSIFRSPSPEYRCRGSGSGSGRDYPPPRSSGYRGPYVGPDGWDSRGGGRGRSPSPPRRPSNYHRPSDYHGGRPSNNHYPTRRPYPPSPPSPPRGFRAHRSPARLRFPFTALRAAALHPANTAAAKTTGTTLLPIATRRHLHPDVPAFRGQLVGRQRTRDRWLSCRHSLMSTMLTLNG
jgi:hypothetical protein